MSAIEACLHVSVSFERTVVQSLVVQGSSSLLPLPPEVAGDIALSIAALVMQRTQVQESALRSCEATREKGLVASEDRMIASMREKAEDAKAAAFEVGVTRVAGGASAAVGATWSTTFESTNTSFAHGVSKGVVESAKVWDASGQWIRGVADGAALGHDAGVECERVTGRRTLRAADDARGELREIKELLGRLIALVREMSQTHRETELTAARRG